MGVGASVSCGTPKTWKDCDQRDDLDETRDVTYRVRDGCPVTLRDVWLFVPRYCDW